MAKLLTAPIRRDIKVWWSPKKTDWQNPEVFLDQNTLSAMDWISMARGSNKLVDHKWESQRYQQATKYSLTAMLKVLPGILY